MSKFYSTLIINISQILNIILNVTFQVLLLKYYEVHFIGTITSNIALVNILSNIFCFGLNNYIISRFSRNCKEMYSYRKIFLIYIVITGLLSLILIVITGYFYGNSIFFSFSFFTLLLSLSLSSFLGSIKQLNKQYIQLALVLLLVPLIKVLAVIISIYFNFNEKILIIGIELLSTIVLILLSMHFVKIFTENKFKTSKISFLFFIKEVFPYGILNICFLFYTNSPIVILGLYGLHQSSAYLSSALLIINCILMIPTIIIQKIYAVDIHNAILNQSFKIQTIRKKLIQYMIVYWIITIILYILFGDFFLEIVFDEKGRTLVMSLNILLFSLIFKMLNLTNGVILSSTLFVKTRVKLEIYLCIFMLLVLFISLKVLSYYEILWMLVIIDLIWSASYYILTKICLRGIRYEKNY
ncbi:hypothetical protein QNJ39_00705 [Macrococcus caseolyticus]|uniref:hypothetical protein n=1 Tax=Macrococcoides caseolyticum TaxID=69966 RepID=UPI0024BC951C|nr:hypothetical protein [Macrococcus caseolyticus]MDJ1090132.1 hypothetical protein [Macrococcus caseolyticus]